jgi:F-type H+-transporting ATP synthase subunit e
VRYSALASGIVYGIVHRRTLQKQQNTDVEKQIAAQREKFVEEARKEWEDRSKKGSTSPSRYP